MCRGWGLPISAFKQAPPPKKKKKKKKNQRMGGGGGCSDCWLGTEGVNIFLYVILFFF